MTLSNRNIDCQSASQRERLLAYSWIFLVAACGVLMPTPSFADPGSASATTTLGRLVCNVKTNGLAVYPYVINVVAYIVGAFLIVRSFMLLKKHAEAPNSPQAIPAAAHMLGGGALLSFPTLLRTIQESLFKSSTGGMTAACEPGSVTSGAAGLDVMMQNFVRNMYSPTFKLLSLLAVVAGMTFIYQGLMRGTKIGTDPRAAAPKDIIANLVFGGILISMGTILPDTLQTLFGSESVSSMTNISIIKWSTLGSTGSTEQADKVVAAVLAFVQIIGGISFLRGWLLMKKTVEAGQPGMPTALTHIIAGAMAINIDKMLKILNTTFGVDVIV